jgi:hypothetical protein
MLARASVLRPRLSGKGFTAVISKSTCVGSTVEVFSSNAEYGMKQTGGKI